MKAALARSQSKINLSFDGWSSPNDSSLLGVVGHWIDERGYLITALLALRPLDGHYGTDIAEVLNGVIKTFNIAGSLGAFQMDNADSNGTALRALSAKLPAGTLDLKDSWLHCFGHIVNLVVKALLYGKGSSRLQRELQALAMTRCSRSGVGRVLLASSTTSPPTWLTEPLTNGSVPLKLFKRRCIPRMPPFTSSRITA